MGAKTVCLLSGGLDSTVCLKLAKDEGYEIYALTFDYGQRHLREIQCAQNIAKKIGVTEHKILDIDLGQIGKSALTDEIEVPSGLSYDEIKKSKDIPVTYVPARNTILLSFALAYAEVKDADAIYIGANHMDYSGYPDCRPEYFKAFQNLADLATKKSVEGGKIIIVTPLLNLDKKGIVEIGTRIDAPLDLTWSCYAGGKKACGVCDSCVLRLNGFKQAGLEDPIEYV